MKFTILIDMDEVLTKTHDAWIEVYNSKGWSHRTVDDIKGWDIHKFVDVECGREIYDYVSKPGFYRNLEEVKGAVVGMKLLKEMGHELIIVTATPEYALNAFAEKCRWVKDHLPFMPHGNIISCHRKDLIAGDILLDDGVHNLRDFKGIAVCYDRPGNQGFQSDMRVKSWSEFINFVRTVEFDEIERWCVLQRADQRLEDTYGDKGFLWIEEGK